MQQCECRAVGCQVELHCKDMLEHGDRALLNILWHFLQHCREQWQMSPLCRLKCKLSLLVIKQTTGAMQDSLNAMQDSLNDMQDAMRDGQNKMQERITALSTRLWRGVALLAVAAIVSIAVLAGVVTMRSGQHSVNGIQYRQAFVG